MQGLIFLEEDVKHFINTILIVVLLTVAGIVFIDPTDLLPPLASSQGETVDWLFGIHLKIIAFLFSLVVVFMLYSVVVFRNKSGDLGDGKYIHGNTKLEIAWTVVPIIMVVIMGYIGVITLRDVTASDPDEMVVEVVSSQWAWRFDYPDHGLSSTELILPVDQPVRFEITSMDVIHDFWVPEFRVKQDAVPGAVNLLRITPTVIGEYKVRCAELCGVRHSQMLADVSVLDREGFDDWVVSEVARIASLDTPEARGEQLYQNQGCIGCHSLDGTIVVGPTWLNLYGRNEELDDGTIVIADEDYLRNSILYPGDQIVSGYQNLMPANYAEILSADDITDLIAYIKTIRE
ncbi:MAG TPA: cytochrome c oxidase subunit II [Chloroflexi bacterium]|nr:cytochrome c oxidase subunit II [Chloroflexota bacterium]